MSGKQKITIRSPTFRQYFATTIGMSYTARNVRIDFGNETTLLTPEKEANVSECQIILDFFSFKSMVNLFRRQLKEIEDNFGKINIKKEKELAEKMKKIKQKQIGLLLEFQKK